MLQIIVTLRIHLSLVCSHRISMGTMKSLDPAHDLYSCNAYPSLWMERGPNASCMCGILCLELMIYIILWVETSWMDSIVQKNTGWQSCTTCIYIYIYIHLMKGQILFSKLLFTTMSLKMTVAALFHISLSLQ